MLWIIFLYTVKMYLSKGTFFFTIFDLISVLWCFAYMYVFLKVLDPLEKDLQIVVSCHMGTRN